MNIPTLPTETPRYTSSTTPKTINDYQNNTIYTTNPALNPAFANLEPTYIQNEIIEKESQKVMGLKLFTGGRISMHITIFENPSKFIVISMN